MSTAWRRLLATGFAGLMLEVALALPAEAQALTDDVLRGTAPLKLDEPLDVAMVRSISRFAEQELSASRGRRAELWRRDYSSPEAYEQSIAPHRDRLRTLLGAVDPLVSDPHVLFDVSTSTLAPLGPPDGYAAIQTQVFEGVTVEALARPGTGWVILLGDADWSPEMTLGVLPGLSAEQGLGQRLFDHHLGVIVPQLIDRSDDLSGHPDIRFTNQPHREFLYRPAFELGRHIIGYEVQKVRALVEAIRADDQRMARTAQPIVVWGVGEGGLLALHAAAIETRIAACVVSGYFQEREQVWREPIYRNIWRQLTQFGDSDVASLIAPRRLVIEASACPEIDGPPEPRDGRSGAAPGEVRTPPLDSVQREFARAREHYDRLGVGEHISLVVSNNGTGPWGSDAALKALLQFLGEDDVVVEPADPPPVSAEDAAARAALAQARHQRQFEELRRHTQRLLHRADKVRDREWAQADRSSLERWLETQEAYRDKVYDELIGRIPYTLRPPEPRTRKILDESTHVGYEVVLDVFAARPQPGASGGAAAADEPAEFLPIIAGGVLLIPKDLKPGERRPCVVCQHGLEGTPMDTIVDAPSAPGYGPYKGFSTQLVKRGFIVYAPQNPYRGHDDFRVLQRKSNPLGRSLFSYIVPQHQQTLNWLASLEFVDPDRIGFYGLSYGGKTAVRVPPLLPPRPAAHGQPAEVGYCLSICSADFNEWVVKNATTEDRYSYVFTGEYEIFEWNMGHVANYAELSSLMTPRPFMVERGHDDGVAPDEWVAWEYAKVQRHYDKLGLGDRTEMEVFNGPHTINGVGTFEFLHRHLQWPAPR